MNRRLVLAEWRRAARSLGAAASCVRDGFFADAVSRSYYAIMHAAKAALTANGVAAESHSAVRRLFGQHLVQTGVFDAEVGAGIGESSDERLSADYDVETEIPESDAVSECARAEDFLRRVRVYLVKIGFQETELDIPARK